MGMFVTGIRYPYINRGRGFVKQMGDSRRIDEAGVPKLSSSEAFLENKIRTNPELGPQRRPGRYWLVLRLLPAVHLMNFQMSTEVTGRVVTQNDTRTIVPAMGNALFGVDGEVTPAALFVPFERDV
ncbi:hypothetical protein NXY56_003117 [Leishmania guyanensis]